MSICVHFRANNRSKSDKMTHNVSILAVRQTAKRPVTRAGHTYNAVLISTVTHWHTQWEDCCVKPVHQASSSSTWWAHVTFSLAVAGAHLCSYRPKDTEHLTHILYMTNMYMNVAHVHSTVIRNKSITNWQEKKHVRWLRRVRWVSCTHEQIHSLLGGDSCDSDHMTSLHFKSSECITIWVNEGQF